MAEYTTVIKEFAAGYEGYYKQFNMNTGELSNYLKSSNEMLSNEEYQQLMKSSGTVVYNIDELKVCGVLRMTNGKVSLSWIKMADIELNMSDKTWFNNLSDSKERSAEEWLDFIENGTVNGVGSIICCRQFAFKGNARVKRSDFVAELRKEFESRKQSVQTSENNELSEEKANEAIEKVEKISSDSNQKDLLAKEENVEQRLSSNDNEEQKSNTSEEMSNLFDKYMSDISARLIVIKNKEEALAKRELVINEKERVLSELLAKAEKAEREEIETVMADIKYEFSSSEEFKNNSSAVNNSTEGSMIIYEVILKALSKDDDITIPFEFYKGMKPVILKNIELNSQYTKYKAVANFKFGKDRYCLTGLLTVNEIEHTVRLKVIKPYNQTQFDSRALAQWCIEYRENNR